MVEFIPNKGLAGVAAPTGLEAPNRGADEAFVVVVDAGAPVELAVLDEPKSGPGVVFPAAGAAGVFVLDAPNIEAPVPLLGALKRLLGCAVGVPASGALLPNKPPEGKALAVVEVVLVAPAAGVDSAFPVRPPEDAGLLFPNSPPLEAG